MTLHATYDDQNIFAKILRGEMACAKVYEDGGTLVIMDAFPQSKGHCLVIPRNSSANLLSVAAKDIGRLFGTVQRVATAVEKALKPDGIVITQYNGAPAGQTVFHTHVHIIPRYAGQALGGHGGDMADMGELQNLATQIRNELEA
jgi:histidine triad (HIT) family protein